MSTPGFRPNEDVECPHCRRHVRMLRVAIRTSFSGKSVNIEAGSDIIVSDPGTPCLSFSRCPSCQKDIVQIELAKQDEPLRQWLVIPKVMGRRAIHDSVPPELVADFEEAVLTLQDSPKSSATLSRRCLQTLLVLQGAKKRDLADQLEEMYSSLPSYVQSFVGNVRKLGNLASHAKQSIATGAIVNVQPGEAEWMLELLEELFDHYYAKPAEAQARQALLTAKFADTQQLKSP